LRKLLLLLLLPLHCSAQTNSYYVTKSGSDTNDGSEAHPWFTLQHAANSMVLGARGTVVHVAPGTYNATTYCYVPELLSGTFMVCMQKSGTPTQPIIFQSDQKWQAKLTCGSVHGNGIFALIGSYIQIVGFDMTCPGAGWGGGTYGDNGHNQFIGNYLHDFDTSGCHSLGILGSTSPDSLTYTHNGHQLFLGNVIRHAGNPAGVQCNQEHGIYMNQPYDMAINNVISGIIGWGIHAYGAGICHQVIVNNTVFDNSQGGIRVENVGSDGRHIDICANGGTTDYETVTNNIVVNNAYGLGYTGQGGIDGRAAHVGSHNLYSNNLLYGNANFDISLYSPDASLNQVTGTDASVFLDYQDDPNWAPAPGYSYLNYALAPGSPAIRAGRFSCVSVVVLCPPPVDIIGVSRATDIGAFESVPQ
jgi:hypothetical protein